MLDKYNNYLISSGISEENLITSNEFIDKYQNYQNISIKGYLITTSGKIYLWIDIPEKEQIPNIETNIPVLDKDGKITLIDKNNIDQMANLNGIQNVFTYYLFKNNKDDLSWYNNNLFNNEFAISIFDYRKVNITLNNKIITNDYLDNLIVNIGTNEDGTYTFKLTNREGNILYNNGNPTIKVPIRLNDYLASIEFNDTIELTNYFNKEYLKQFTLNNEVDIPNKEYISFDEVNDKVVINQRPTIILDNNIDNEIDINTVLIKPFTNELTKETINYLCIESNIYPLNIDYELNEPIFLSNILNYYGISNIQYPYKLTTEELTNLFNEYLKDTLIKETTNEYKTK